MALKLRQGQVWKHGSEFIRIVRLQRLEVGYKSFLHLDKPDAGQHHITSKKDFCRLLKSATLLAPKKVVAPKAAAPSSAVPSSPPSAVPPK